MTTTKSSSLTADTAAKRRYASFLILVAGLGGLLYGIDVGIIAGAIPYLEATSHLSPAQLSIIVAAVLLGTVFSTIFAGMLADWLGRKPLMVLSGVAFVLSIPVIALSQGYGTLFCGRLLQGMSGGLVGVVVPLYLAECLSASNRGKGTGTFQWMLTLGLVAASLVGIYYSYRVHAVSLTADSATLFEFKNQAWRRIFWVSLPPGVLFVLGSLVVSESPRWLFRRGKIEKAYAALLRSRSADQAGLEMREMEETARLDRERSTGKDGGRESLLKRKFVLPFLMTLVILACNTATGINSLNGYNVVILLQSGLSDVQAHWGHVLFTFVNFSMAMVGMMLVDRKGRRFLFMVGTSGIIISLAFVGILFLRTERDGVDAARQLQSMVGADQELKLRFDPAFAGRLLTPSRDAVKQIKSSNASLAIIYSYGDFTAVTSSVRSDDSPVVPLSINRESCVPANKVESFFKNPFADLDAARSAPLRIQKAVVSQIPEAGHGWSVALGLYLFMAFYSVGPGVCVWLALSELMPTRIRSNGMSIALVVNQLVSTILAGIFLPFVSKHGYSSMFFLFAAFTVVYFVAVTFFLPETMGKTLEEIEAHFEGTVTS